MEQNLQDLNVNGLNMKLTTEKLFVNSATATETFALRSINGVGIVDLVNKFDDELKEWNAKNNPKGLTEEQIANNKKLYKIIGIVAIVVALILLVAKNPVWYVAVIGGGISLLMGYFQNSNLPPKPTMKSAVRIMFSGMNRDFEFNKKSSEANDVAKFVALVEDTLTSYHSKIS
jgi:uncharacterized membrane protein YkgB